MAFKAVWDAPTTFMVHNNNDRKYPVPNGVGRAIAFDHSFTDAGIKVAFGPANLTTANAVPVDQGHSEFIIPDGATTMAIRGAKDCNVVGTWGYAEGDRAAPTEAVDDDLDPLDEDLDP